MDYDPKVHEAFQNRATMEVIHVARSLSSRYRSDPYLVSAWRPLDPAYVETLANRYRMLEATIMGLHNAHEGHTAFILGGGESASGHFTRQQLEEHGFRHCWSDAELGALTNSLTIAVNLPPLFMQPTYAFAGDGVVDDKNRGMWSAFLEMARDAREHHMTGVIMNVLADLPSDYEPDYRVARVNASLFAKTPKDGIAWNRSSAQGAADLARHMGCARIVFLGVDYNGRGHHYDKDVKDSMSNSGAEWGLWTQIVDEFRGMYKAFADKGIEVLNGNPLSRLDVMPKVNIHEFLADYRPPKERVRPVLANYIDIATTQAVKKVRGPAMLEAEREVPLLSVIIPNHGRWSYIAKNLPALLKRTMYPHACIEVLVVNDGPGDPTPGQSEAITASVQGLSRFEILTTGNSQYGCCTPARNMGTRAACGRLLLFTEPEIEHQCDSISFVASALLADPECYVGPERLRMYSRWQSGDDTTPRATRVGVHAAFGVHRDVLMQMRGYDDRFQSAWGWSDQRMFWALEAYGLRLARPEGLVVVHQDHPRPPGVTNIEGVEEQKQMALDPKAPIVQNGPSWYDGPGARPEDAAEWKAAAKDRPGPVLTRYGRLYDKVWACDRYRQRSPEVRALPRLRKVLESLANGDGRAVSALSVGCGEGKAVRELVGAGYDAKGLDVSGLALAVARKEAPDRFAVADCTRLTEPPFGTVDLLYAVDVLEHLSEEDIPPFMDFVRSCNPKRVYFEVATCTDKGWTHIDGVDVDLHFTVKPADWWKERLGREMPVLEAVERPKGQGVPAVMLTLEGTR